MDSSIDANESGKNGQFARGTEAGGSDILAPSNLAYTVTPEMQRRVSRSGFAVVIGWDKYKVGYLASPILLFSLSVVIFVSVPEPFAMPLNILVVFALPFGLLLQRALIDMYAKTHYPVGAQCHVHLGEHEYVVSSGSLIQGFTFAGVKWAVSRKGVVVVATQTTPTGLLLMPVEGFDQGTLSQLLQNFARA